MRTRNALTRGWRLTVREPLNLSHVRARVRLEKTIKRSLIMKPQMIDIDWTVVAAFTLVFVTFVLVIVTFRLGTITRGLAKQDEENV